MHQLSRFAEKINASKYSLSYLTNGADSGSALQRVSDVSGSKIVVSNNSGSLAKSGYAFAGWNTASDGSGTAYAPGATFTMPDKESTLLPCGPSRHSPSRLTATRNDRRKSRNNHRDEPRYDGSNAAF